MESNSGKILKSARKRKNLSIEEISESTKIARSVIRKIEDSKFKEITSFQKKYFTKIYAKFLGVENEIKPIELNKEYSDLSLKENNFEVRKIGFILDNYRIPTILIVTLTLITIITVFYSLGTTNKSYLEKLSAIDKQLSENFYANDNNSKNFLFNEYDFDNTTELTPKINNVSANQEYIQPVSSGILDLYFKKEVWIEIDNDEDVLLSRVFQKNDKISLDVFFS